MLSPQGVLELISDMARTSPPPPANVDGGRGAVFRIRYVYMQIYTFIRQKIDPFENVRLFAYMP